MLVIISVNGYRTAAFLGQSDLFQVSEGNSFNLFPYNVVPQDRNVGSIELEWNVRSLVSCFYDLDY